MREIKAAAPVQVKIAIMDQSFLHHGPVILVVDDDGAVRRALEFALDLEGFEVETFESGEALLLRAAPLPQGCLVLDERLPGVSGLNTLRQLRGRGVDLPAILITSHPGPALREAAARADVPILEKPLLAETLVDAIYRVLEPPAAPTGD